MFCVCVFANVVVGTGGFVSSQHHHHHHHQQQQQQQHELNAVSGDWRPCNATLHIVCVRAVNSRGHNVGRND